MGTHVRLIQSAVLSEKIKKEMDQPLPVLVNLTQLKKFPVACTTGNS